MPWNREKKKTILHYEVAIETNPLGRLLPSRFTFLQVRPREGRAATGGPPWWTSLWVLTSHVPWLPGTTLFHGHHGEQGFHTHHSCSLRCWLEHLNGMEPALGWAVSKTLGYRQKYPHHFNLPLLSVCSKTEPGALRQMSQLVTGVAPSDLCFLAISIMIP